MIALLQLMPVPGIAQQPSVCEVAAVAPPPASLPAVPSASEQTLILEAGKVEATFGARPQASMSDGVRMTSGARSAGADTALYDPDRMALLLNGNVEYRDPRNRILSDSAEFSYSTGQIIFNGAEFQLGIGGSRGAAEKIAMDQGGTLSLDEVSYTTCPPGSEDWLLQAADIDLDTNSGVGTARNVKLRFQGVPILYAPWLSFPLGDARKTGLLTPELGSAGRSGNQISVPWYWNISNNYDATFTPRLLTDRGLQLGSEFRYLSKRDEGLVRLEYLADDALFGDSRHLLSYQNNSRFANGWRNRIQFRQVSDSQFFEDLGGSLSASSITHLNRAISFDYFAENWSFLGRLQDYQTIDDAIAPEDEPYQRLPQLRVRGVWPEQALGFRYSIDSELVYFDRDVGVTGWRLDASPQVEWPMEHAGWFVNPSLTLRHTRYELDNVLPGQRSDASRSLPIASIDTGIILERPINSGSNLIQTLEPRMLYVHIPFRDQDHLPVFDTIAPDLNLVQLYRPNRYIGADRIADTDQLSIGVTSRILNTSSGKELVSATIGQARYLSTQGVYLPNQNISGDASSDYIAELHFPLYENLNFDVGHQWGQEATTQSEARLQYRPTTDRIVNLSYRFRRDSLEQGDISWSWPLSERWRFVGRYNYSLRDNKALEQFYGLEFESCCWGLRLVSRRHISTRDGTRDSSIGLQLVLKGMTSLGTAADKLLERGILGYDPDLL